MPNDTRGPWGLKLPAIFLIGEEKPRKNLTQETCPDQGLNPAPLRDKRACYHMLHSGGQQKNGHCFLKYQYFEQLTVSPSWGILRSTLLLTCLPKAFQFSMTVQLHSLPGKYEWTVRLKKCSLQKSFDWQQKYIFYFILFAPNCILYSKFSVSRS